MQEKKKISNLPKRPQSSKSFKKQSFTETSPMSSKMMFNTNQNKNNTSTYSSLKSYGTNPFFTVKKNNNQNLGTQNYNLFQSQYTDINSDSFISKFQTLNTLQSDKFKLGNQQQFVQQLTNQSLNQSQIKQNNFNQLFNARPNNQASNSFASKTTMNTMQTQQNFKKNKKNNKQNYPTIENLLQEIENDKIKAQEFEQIQFQTQIDQELKYHDLKSTSKSQLKTQESKISHQQQTRVSLNEDDKKLLNIFKGLTQKSQEENQSQNSQTTSNQNINSQKLLTQQDQPQIQINQSSLIKNNNNNNQNSLFKKFLTDRPSINDQQQSQQQQQQNQQYKVNILQSQPEKIIDKELSKMQIQYQNQKQPIQIIQGIKQNQNVQQEQDSKQKINKSNQQIPILNVEKKLTAKIIIENTKIKKKREKRRQQALESKVIKCNTYETNNFWIQPLDVNENINKHISNYIKSDMPYTENIQEIKSISNQSNIVEKMNQLDLMDLTDSMSSHSQEKSQKDINDLSSSISITDSEKENSFNKNLYDTLKDRLGEQIFQKLITETFSIKINKPEKNDFPKVNNQMDLSKICEEASRRSTQNMNCSVEFYNKRKFIRRKGIYIPIQKHVIQHTGFGNKIKQLITNKKQVEQTSIQEIPQSQEILKSDRSDLQQFTNRSRGNFSNQPKITITSDNLQRQGSENSKTSEQDIMSKSRKYTMPVNLGHSNSLTTNDQKDKNFLTSKKTISQMRSSLAQLTDTKQKEEYLKILQKKDNKHKLKKQQKHMKSINKSGKTISLYGLIMLCTYLKKTARRVRQNNKFSKIMKLKEISALDLLKIKSFSTSANLAKGSCKNNCPKPYIEVYDNPVIPDNPQKIKYQKWYLHQKEKEDLILNIDDQILENEANLTEEQKQQYQELIQKDIKSPKSPKSIIDEEDNSDLSDEQQQEEKQLELQQKKQKNLEINPDTYVELFQLQPRQNNDKPVMSTIKQLINIKRFKNKIKQKINGLKGDGYLYSLKYPDFKFMSILFGRPIKWIVKHSHTQVDIPKTNQMESSKKKLDQSNQKKYGSLIQFSQGKQNPFKRKQIFQIHIIDDLNQLKIPLDIGKVMPKDVPEYDKEKQKQGIPQFQTVWPLYYIAFSKFLENNNIFLQEDPSESEVDKSELYNGMKFLDSNTITVQECLTNIDILYIGRLANRLQHYVRYCHCQERKINGTLLSTSQKEVFNDLALEQLRKSQKNLARNEVIQIYEYNQKGQIEDDVTLQNQALTKARLNFQQISLRSRIILMDKLEEIWNKTFIMFTFLKKSTGGLFYLVTIRLVFLGNFSTIKERNDLLDEKGLLNPKYFSLMLGGKRMIYDLQLYPIQIRLQSISEFLNETNFISEVSRFILYGKVRRSWAVDMVDFFTKKLGVTISELHSEKVNVQKFYFKEKGYNDKKEKIRISKVQIKSQVSQNVVPQILSFKSSTKISEEEQKQNKELEKNRNIFNDIFDNLYFTNYRPQIFQNQYIGKKIEDEDQDDELVENLKRKFLKPTQDRPYIDNSEGSKNIKVTFPKNKYLTSESVMNEGLYQYQNKVFFVSSKYYNTKFRIAFKVNENLHIIVTDIQNNCSSEFTMAKNKWQLIYNMLNLHWENDYNQKYHYQKIQQYKFTSYLLRQLFIKKKVPFGKVYNQPISFFNTSNKPLIFENPDSIREHLIGDSQILRKYYDKQKTFFAMQMKYLGWQDILLLDSELTLELKHSVYTVLMQRLIKFLIEKCLVKRQYLSRSIIFPISIFKNKHQESDILMNSNNSYNLLQKSRFNDSSNGILKGLNRVNKVKRDQLLLNSLKSIQNKQDTVDSDKENSNSSQIIKTQEALFMLDWKNKINNLRYYKNTFVRHNYDSKSSKTMLDQFVVRYRIIHQMVKRMNNQYTVITVQKDLLLDQFEINIYIPKSGRNLSAIFSKETLMQLHPDFLEGKISSKLEFFFDNQNMSEFKSYHQFSRRMALQNIEDIESVTNVDIKNNNQQFNDPNGLKRFFRKKIRHLLLCKKITLKNILDKHKLQIKQNFIQPKMLINTFMSRKVRKNKKVQKLLQIAEYMDKEYKERYQSKRGTHLVRFIELKVWESFIDSCEFVPDDTHQFISLSLGNIKYNIKERLFSQYVSIDQQNEIFVDISIDFIQCIHLGSHLIGMSQENNQINVNLKSFKKNLLDFYFIPIEFIKYVNTSYFTFSLEVLSINKAEIQQHQIGVREMINTFIAEGFYKYQTNYMNSRLSYNDIKNICNFMVFKLKYSNFKEMMDEQKTVKIMSILNQTLDQISANDETLNYKNHKRKQVIAPGNEIYFYQLLLDIKSKAFLRVKFFTKDQNFQFIIYESSTDTTKIFAKNLSEISKQYSILLFLYKGEQYVKLVQKAACLIQKDMKIIYQNYKKEEELRIQLEEEELKIQQLENAKKLQKSRDLMSQSDQQMKFSRLSVQNTPTNKQNFQNSNINQKLMKRNSHNPITFQSGFQQSRKNSKKTSQLMSDSQQKQIKSQFKIQNDLQQQQYRQKTKSRDKSNARSRQNTKISISHNQSQQINQNQNQNQNQSKSKSKISISQFSNCGEESDPIAFSSDEDALVSIPKKKSKQNSKAPSRKKSQRNHKPQKNTNMQETTQYQRAQHNMASSSEHQIYRPSVNLLSPFIDENLAESYSKKRKSSNQKENKVEKEKKERKSERKKSNISNIPVNPQQNISNNSKRKITPQKIVIDSQQY